MADHQDRRHAEKACQRAEEMFLVGNIRGAHRQAIAAKRLCPSLTAATHALDAYEIHSAAAVANWRGVLGMAPGTAKLKHGDLKKRFRRQSVLVHPDRNHSAAASSAFRLLLQAYDALSDRSEEPLLPSLPWWMERDEKQRPDNKEFGRHQRQRPRWKEPPCKFKVIYCRFCKDEFARPCGPLEEQAGMMCEDCHKWLRPPWEKKPPAADAPATTTTNKEKAATPPPRPKPPTFPCPAECPACAARYSCNVSVGKWCLKCKACGKSSMVDVQGPDVATTAKSGRAS